MGIEIDLVDKSIHPRRVKAIFYDLSLLVHGGKPFKSLLILSSLLLFVVFIFIETPTLHLLAALPALFILVFPFFTSAIAYHSKLYIYYGKFEVRCGLLKYHSGPLSNLIEIHHLKHKFNGVFRVRVQGVAETSGFILHYREVPEPLSFLKVIEKDI